ncbi:DUF6531 domain-containing protein, partial [Luteimonas huabeiensis]|uniref:DUF6531 domain-containing protein n=1 Tax=Luteimonas huabeiensis TaxID=1244513 RepID=UPI001F26F5F5
MLIWGGAGKAGELQNDGLIFDPELSALEPVALPFAGRANHTATVLTDGRILLAGGRSNASGYALWHEDTGEAVELQEAPVLRGGHRADLLADGRVRLMGSRHSGDVLVFDPADDRVRRVDVRELQETGKPGLAASRPMHGADDVPTTQRLSLRFAQRIAVRSVGDSNVVLLGTGGSTPVETVVVEDGRLAFVSPRQELFPGTPYTLLIDGLETVAGEPVERIAIDFRTAPSVTERQVTPEPQEYAETPVTATDPSPPTGIHCGDASIDVLPCEEKATLVEGVWTPGRANTDGRWRLPGRQADLMPTQLMARVTEAVGLTSLTGQILRVDGEPVGGVEVSVGTLKARTDAQGRFWLYQVPAGRQELYVDGTTANRPGVEYGQFVVGADVAAGTLNQLPYTMYLPRISERDKVRIDSPLARDVVLTHPDMPGLQVHVPAGTVVRDRKGRLVRELAIVPTPVNRAPFPVAENYPMYFTIEPGGAVVQGLNPESARGIRVFYPNYDQHPAGTQADFWIYDPAEGWRVYGKGRVTSDESRFAPEAGVALHQTMGGSYSVNTNDPAPEDDLPPDCQSCGEGNAGTGQNATAGDPIDLRTGQFSYQETDIVIADVVPISLARSYSPRDLKRRDFGIGTASNFGYRLHAVSGTSNNVMQLVMPNGAKLLFQRASGTGLQGSWRNYGTSSLSGSLLQQVSDNGYKYRLTLRDGSMMQFAGYSPNRLLWTQDRYGNRTEYVHDAGLVSRIVSPNGRYIVLEYDSNSRISRAIDQQGAAWQYAYNSAGLLSKVTYPDGTERNYHYELFNWAFATHRIREIHDRRGNVLLKNEWVAGINDQNHGRVTKQTLADGSVYHIDYYHMVGEERGVLVTHPDGSQRRVVFDKEGGLYPVSDTLAYGTPLAQTFTFERDSVGRMTARIDPLGRRTEYEYDAIGQVTRVTSLAGTPQAISASVTYNADSQPVQVTDALGRSTTLAYDNGCLIRITNPLGYSTALTCNTAGQPNSVVDALSNVTSLGYLGPDLASVTDPLGRSVQFRHDALGRVIAAEDAQGNLTRREYDAEGRVVKTVDAAGEPTEIGYDPNGNVTAVLMPNGSGITYEYDSRDRLVERTDNLGQSESWTWDTMSRVASYTDRKGQTTTYAYDALGRPTSTTYADGSTVTATYDAGDRLLSLTDSVSGTLSWVYDDLDRVIEAISPQGSIAYEYDAAGRRTAMTAASQPRVEYQYDANDRLTRILQGAETVEFAYDALDRLTQQSLPNGIETGYAYNAASQVGGIAWRRPDGTPLHALGYGYDSAGRRVAQTGSLAPQALPPASTGANTFDDNNRQLQYNGAALTYDANGNLTS